MASEPTQTGPRAHALPDDCCGRGCVETGLQNTEHKPTPESTVTILLFMYYMHIMHYFGASLMAQLVRNPPAMQEAPGSIPGLGRSAEKGIGYPLQYSWASLVAQLVKNPPAMREIELTLGLGRSPREGKGCPLQYSGLENSMDCRRVGHD